jgi:hypothetical protein
MRHDPSLSELQKKTNDFTSFSFFFSSGLPQARRLVSPGKKKKPRASRGLGFLLLVIPLGLLIHTCMHTTPRVPRNNFIRLENRKARYFCIWPSW